MGVSVLGLDNFLGVIAELNPVLGKLEKSTRGPRVRGVSRLSQSHKVFCRESGLVYKE